MTGLTTTGAAGRRWRIAVGGLGTESSTFAPQTMTAADFTPRRGAAIASPLPFVADGSHPDVEWVPTLHAWGDPSGPIEPDAYDALETELLDRLAGAGTLDGVVLDLHGAMSVAGRERCEERLLERVREVVGAGPLVSLAMDPHGNLSFELARSVDLATCYRLAPHRDKQQTRRRAARTLVECLRGGVRPVRYWVDVPMLLNGERTSTDVEPGRSVFASADTATGHPDIIDAGIWIGFAWADEERCRASVLVTGREHEPVRHAAEQLARGYWDRRRDFGYVSPRSGGFDEAIVTALAHLRRPRGRGPFVISDSGDNVTAGAPGDATHTLRAVLASPLRDLAAAVVYAGIPDAAAVAACVRAGIGNRVRLELGGHLETRHGAPVEADATVRAIAERPDGLISVLADLDGVQVIVAGRRSRWTDDDAFRDLGLDPGAIDVLVVKNGYLFPDQRAICADWFMAITPGATDLDDARLDYRNLAHPLFPFDDPVDAPLRARLVPDPETS